MKKQIAVFISGRGTNFKSIIEHTKHVSDCNYEVALCITDNANAYGLIYAEEENIPVVVITHISQYEDILIKKLTEYHIELLVLAGFMKILPPRFCDIWYGKCVNIHPSLLPHYPGLNTHRRVLENKEKEHGLSIHFVDSGIDTGPLIFQVRLNIEDVVDENVLSTVILIYENWFYPLVIDSIIRGDITLMDRFVYNKDEKLEKPLEVFIETENFDLKI